MADIFISYSRKDSSHALEISKQLRASGIEVWVDQHGIIGAEKWATEIVEGIRACSTFLLLISPDSVESENVLKELSLASEKRKRILPVDICPTILPSSFEYPLAGLQRIAVSDFDGILRAHKHGVAHVSVKDQRKSLIVLPFEDLSPANEDNVWFADGLTSELISCLSQIKSLRIPDRKTSMDLKGFHGKTTEIARELNIRYFIEGNVRKFGEQIKISVDLLDIETGDHLWQHSYKGKFEDIFDIQEAVAQEVVAGLNLSLTTEEQQLIEEHGTESAEAYELSLKANEFFYHQTKTGFQHAIQLWSDAIKADPKYAYAYQSKANALAALYSDYDRNPEHLSEAEALVKKAFQLKPDMWIAYSPLSHIYLLQGKLEAAENTAKEYIKKAPNYIHSHFSLGFFYMQTDQREKAIAPFEEAVRLKPGNLQTLCNLTIVSDSPNTKEKCEYWSLETLPYLEKHLKLHPDDEANLVFYAHCLRYAGKLEESVAAAKKLYNMRDGSALYNAACLIRELGEPIEGLKLIRKSIEAGFRQIDLLKDWLQEETDTSNCNSVEYKEVFALIEKMEAEQQAI